MALPNPLQIALQDQIILTISNAAVWSRKNVVHYDDSTYRNTMANHQLTLKPSNIASITEWDTDTATLQVPGTPGATTVVNSNTTTMNSRIILDDVAAAIEPRIWKKVRTKIEFWSGAIGRQMTMTVTLASGNATITVPDNSQLTPGQTITGTGIPTGATILCIPLDSTTTVILSHKATATGDEAATLGGSDYCGGYFEDEGLGDAEEIAILQ